MIHNFSHLVNKFNQASFSSHSRPTLALAGFYGYGNYGDELFLDVWKKYLGSHFNLVIMHDRELKPYFSEGRLTDFLGTVDGIIIGGGDILQPWNIDPRYWSFEYLSKPVWVAGIGVPIRQDPTQAEVEWKVDKMRKYLEHDNVRMVVSRDQVSHQWINERFSISQKSYWCPDLVTSLKDSHFQKAELDPANKRKQLGIVVRSRPGKEDSDDFSQIEKFAQNSFLNGWDINVIVLGTGRTLVADLHSSLRLTFDFPVKYLFSNETSKLTHALTSQDSLFSMKFHGTLAASMAGIPSIVGIRTQKNTQFMKQINCQDLCIGFDAIRLAQMSASDISGPVDGDIDSVSLASSDMLEKITVDIVNTLCQA